MLDPRTFHSVQWSNLIEKQKQVIAENLEDFLRLTLNLAMVPPGNITGKPAKPMSYNNAYKKGEEIPSRKHASGISAAYPEVPTWMHFRSRRDAQLQFQRQLDAHGTMKTWKSSRFQHIRSWKTFPRVVEIPWTTQPCSSPCCQSVLLRGQTRSWSIFDSCCSDFLCACELRALCRMNVRIQQITRWIPQTVGPGANLKPHELELLSAESRLASGIWKTRGN